MRRLFVILIGLVILVCIIVVVMFGLKSPEIPMKEVHKVFPASKFEVKPPAPALPTVPPVMVPSQQNGQQVPINGNAAASGQAAPAQPQPLQQPLPSVLPPSSVPQNAMNKPVGN